MTISRPIPLMALMAAVFWILFSVLLSPPVRDGKTLWADEVAPSKVPATVEVTIDYADGAQKRYPKIPWKEEFTVFDALVWVDKHPRGIKLTSRGKNALAFVSQIDDLKNGDRENRNWIFYVNGKQADRGCGAVKLRPKDKILWRFEHYK